MSPRCVPAVPDPQKLQAVAATAANAALFIKSDAKAQPGPGIAPASGMMTVEYSLDPRENWENQLHVPDEEVPVDRWVGGWVAGRVCVLRAQ